MATEHVYYEAKSLVAPFFVSSDSPWLSNVRLEVVMVHVRCLYAFLTGANARSTDVLAKHYFEATDVWTSPPVVIGNTAQEQTDALDEMNPRLFHIGRKRLEPFSWEQLTPYAVDVAKHFVQFVDDLRAHRHTDRMLWFFPAMLECRRLINATEGSGSAAGSGPAF